jgi:hypothetical protein
LIEGLKKADNIHLIKKADANNSAIIEKQKELYIKILESEDKVVFEIDQSSDVSNIE